MALPTKQEIEIPLLEELQNAGGSLSAKDACDHVTARFPGISFGEEKTETLGGKSVWTNRIQWARLNLKYMGQIGSKERGVWNITALGRQRLEDHRREDQLGEPKATGKAKAPKRQASAVRFDHDELARAMMKIGEAFGFEAKWKPQANHLRPDKIAISSKRKTLDVGWQIGKLAWVPIEVQVGGSVPDLVYRFQQVHQWSLRLVVVTVDEFMPEIKEVIAGYPFSDKVVVLSPKQVIAATHNLDSLLKLKALIFES